MSLFRGAVAPISVEEFMFALSVGEAASRQQIPMKPPSAYRFVVGGRVFGLTDDALNRFGLAIAEQFGEEHEKFMAIMWRWLAWVRLRDVAGDRLQRWIRASNEDGKILVHPGLMEAVATAPLTLVGDPVSFDVDELLKHVERLRAEKYPDDDEPQDE